MWDVSTNLLFRGNLVDQWIGVFKGVWAVNI